MASTVGTIPKPVRVDKGGGLKVGGTRVSLDSVVYAFNRGEDAAEIQRCFDTLSLAEVHAAIAYYLHNKADVDEYLHRRKAESDRLRKKHATPGLREQLLARRGKPPEEWEPLKF